MILIQYPIHPRTDSFFMFFILLVFLSLACFPVAGVATIHPIKTPKTNRSISKKHTIYTQIATRSETLAKVHSRSKRRAKLLSNYRHWHGTRYRLGGTTHRAVDCSALTRNLYWETFQMKLPRTTGGQLNRGKRIARGRLRIGDLVFFTLGTTRIMLACMSGKAVLSTHHEKKA